MCMRPVVTFSARPFPEIDTVVFIVTRPYHVEDPGCKHCIRRYVRKIAVGIRDLHTGHSDIR